jgi:23S rRNA G2069 N7-methylase RlmK/C1962 C5-methylase RlmI
VDSSGLALDLARRNAALNGFEAQCEFIQADVDKFLRAVHLPGGGQEGDVAGASDAREVDVVICDPPKLAPSVKDLPRAIPKYRIWVASLIC